MAFSRPNWLMGAIQLVFVIAVIALALAFSAALKPKPFKNDGSGVIQSDGQLSVSVVSPYSTSYAPIIALNGSVASQTQTQITPQVGGRVIGVSKNFKQGGIVKKGETLFRIDPQDYRLAVEQAEANIAAALSDMKVMEAEVELSKREWTDLFPGEPISDLAAKKPQLASARARLDGAKAAKKTAALALSRTRVIAASDAKVLATTLDVGQVVAPNQMVGQVFALDNVEIAVPISTDDLQLLAPAIGRKSNLSFSGGEAKRGGDIVRLDSVLDPRTRLATLFIKPESAADLTVGSFVDVSIEVPAIENALRLPITALSGRNTVWVVSDGALYKRDVVRLGESGQFVYLAGFNIGEGVLILPPVEAYEGQKAKIRVTDGAVGTE